MLHVAVHLGVEGRDSFFSLFSPTHLIETVELLGKRGVWFQSLQEGFDTTTAGVKLVFV